MVSFRLWKCILFFLLCAGCTDSQDGPKWSHLARSDTGGAKDPAAAPEEGDIPVILFLCPHNASKSVMAAAHFQRLADECDLGMRALAAGTHPGEKIDPRVIQLLRKHGISYEEHAPRKVTGEQMEAAHRVVSLGCDPADLPSAPTPLIRWDDVPPPSQDLDRAHDDIAVRVEALVNELSR